MEINLHAAGTTIPIILTPEKCISTTWGELCQDVVQNFLTAADSKLMLKILTEIYPTERLTHYHIRYGDGNSSIIRVDWSSSSVPGFDPLPLSAAYIDVNMVLKPRVRGNLAKPHLPVQPTTVGGTVSFPTSFHVDLCFSVASSAEPPFPYNEDQMSVLYLKEHAIYAGCVDTYEIMAADGYHDLLPTVTRVPQVSSAAAAISADTPVAARKKRQAPSTASSLEESKAKSSKKREEGGPSKSDNNSDVTMEKPVATSNKGELKSIVDPSFSEKYPGVMEAAFKVLDYLYLHPSHAPWVEGAGFLLAAESCYGNEAIMNMHRDHYLRQSFAKTDFSSIPVDDNTRECFVYGVGYGSSTFGTVAEQVAYREWTVEMQIIADAIEKELVNKFSADKGVDANIRLNELEVISFYDSKKITYHRDQSYTAEGQFMANNCQKRHTCTCIFVLGDERVLEFQLFRGKEKVRHSEAQKKITLPHGAIFFLHPEDEEDALRKVFEMNERTHFKHRNNGVKGGLLSIGLVFRACVQTRTVYKGTGQLVLTSENSKATETTSKCNRKMKEYEQCWTKRKMDEYLKDKYLSMKQRHSKG